MDFHFYDSMVDVTQRNGVVNVFTAWRVNVESGADGCMYSWTEDGGLKSFCLALFPGRETGIEENGLLFGCEIAAWPDELHEVSTRTCVRVPVGELDDGQHICGQILLRRAYKEGGIRFVEGSEAEYRDIARCHAESELGCELQSSYEVRVFYALDDGKYLAVFVFHSVSWKSGLRKDGAFKCCKSLAVTENNGKVLVVGSMEHFVVLFVVGEGRGSIFDCVTVVRIWRKYINLSIRWRALGAAPQYIYGDQEK